MWRKVFRVVFIEKPKCRPHGSFIQWDAGVRRYSTEYTFAWRSWQMNNGLKQNHDSAESEAKLLNPLKVDNLTESSWKRKKNRQKKTQTRTNHAVSLRFILDWTLRTRRPHAWHHILGYITTGGKSASLNNNKEHSSSEAELYWSHRCLPQNLSTALRLPNRESICTDPSAGLFWRKSGFTSQTPGWKTNRVRTTAGPNGSCLSVQNGSGSVETFWSFNVTNSTKVQKTVPITVSSYHKRVQHPNWKFCFSLLCIIALSRSRRWWEKYNQHFSLNHFPAARFPALRRCSSRGAFPLIICNVTTYCNYNSKDKSCTLE